MAQSRSSSPTNRPLERFLVASDFSVGSENAIDRVALLPVARDAEIQLLHVLPDKLGAMQTSADHVRAQLAKDAGALEKRLRGRSSPHPTVTPVVAVGHPFAEIAKHARETDAELIVLGRRGAGGFKKMLLGSTAERVARNGEFPVLVVRGAPSGPYQHALVAMEAAATAMGTAEAACRILGNCEAKVDVVHSVELPIEWYLRRGGAREADIAARRREVGREARREVTAATRPFLELGVRAQLIMRHGDPRAAILRTAKRRHADLLVMGTHARTGVAHALVGSVAAEVLQHAPCDVLIVRSHGVIVAAP